MVDDAVENKKGPKVDGKKITYHHLHDFLQDILNKKFNDREEARKFYVENILNKYEIPVRNNTNSSGAFVNLINAYNMVKKIFIKNSKSNISNDDTSK